MKNAVICLLPGDADERGNLYRGARWKLEEVAGGLRPFVEPAISWLHDGSRQGVSTIATIAPHFGIQVTRHDLEQDMAAIESQKMEEKKAASGGGSRNPEGKNVAVATEPPKPGAQKTVSWLPVLESCNIQGPFRSELQSARDEVFKRLAKGSSVLLCVSERYFRAFFEFVAGTS